MINWKMNAVNIASPIFAGSFQGGRGCAKLLVDMDDNLSFAPEKRQPNQGD